jgi:hypothetical protein
VETVLDGSRFAGRDRYLERLEAASATTSIRPGGDLTPLDQELRRLLPGGPGRSGGAGRRGRVIVDREGHVTSAWRCKTGRGERRSLAPAFSCVK